MNATNIEQTILNFKQNILKKLHHRTLLEYTGQPAVENEQLLYLLLPALNGEKWSDKEEIAAETVAMITAALNTHDLVEEDEATSKTQQLVVLAGDYYSGLYYATLASLPDVPLIGLLSESVAEICEVKTYAYEEEVHSFEQWMQYFEIIASKSVEQFLKRYHFEQYVPVAKLALLINKVANEYTLVKNNRISRLSAAVQRSTQQSLETLYAQQLATLREQFEQQVTSSSLLDIEVQQFIVNRIEALTGTQHMTREG